MSKILKNETFLRSRLLCGIPFTQTTLTQTPFGSSLYIGEDVILKIDMVYDPIPPEFYSFNCITKNLRDKKLLCNYTLELSVGQGSSEPINVITKSREGVELEENQGFYTGFDKVWLNYFEGDDTLELLFKITFEDIPIPDVEPLTPSNSVLLNKFSCLYLEENFKDLMFKIGNEELMAHRLVLVDRSKVFHAMLMHDTKERKEGVIEIKDCEVDSFKAFLKYLYTDEIDDMKNRAVDLLILADKYDVECLKEKCEDYLCEMTDKVNAISHLIAAYLSNSILLKTTALNEIKLCVKKILKSRDARLLNDYPLLYREIMLIFDC